MSLQQLNSLSSPLSPQQIDSLKQLTASMSAVELSWVSGYLAGISQGGAVAPVVDAPAGKLTVMYGSQTGNSKGVASEVAEQASALGINVELVSMGNYKAKQLKNETHLLIVVSTNGEGEPPDDAIQLHEFLASKRAPKLDGLKYSVLGLGDTSYEFFCQTAIDFDERLSALGAESVLARKDCDVDYEDDAQTWATQALSIVQDTLLAAAPTQVATSTVAGVGGESQYTKKNPYKATLLANPKITARGANKDVRHIEISLEDSGITYQPGDALGVWFDNDRQLVAELLTLLSIDATTQVDIGGESLTIEQALVEHYELTQLHPGFISGYGEAASMSELVELAKDKDATRAYISERQIVDVVRQYPAAITAEQLVASLRKLTPRLYSIASAMSEVEEEVHLTVAVVEYDAHGYSHQGAASSFLAHRLEEDAEVRVFVEHNDNFRLPAADKSAIMIGPGTGIAPFRAFLQERDNTEASGDNWLFFGNQHFTDDFLYQVELQDFKERGVLNRIDLAFSRDQEHKVYVQHLIKEQGAELYQWLENGASVYICGDANYMAKDVHQALLDVVSEHGKKTVEQANDYLINLRDSKRYQKDVY